MSESDVKLAPCPWCNGALLEIYESGEGIALRCTDCDCRGPSEIDGEQAYRSWNRRGGWDAGRVAALAPAPAECTGGRTRHEWYQGWQNETQLYCCHCGATEPVVKNVPLVAPAPADTVRGERERFEAWAQRTHGGWYGTGRTADGSDNEYVDAAVRFAWKAWQAATAPQGDGDE